MSSCVEDSGELKDGENADKVGGEVEDGEEVENGERLEDGNDDDTGTETGEAKAMLMTRAEIYKLEEEMVVWSSSVWMPWYGILLERKW